MCCTWLGNGVCGRDFGTAFDYKLNMIPQYDMAAKKKAKCYFGFILLLDSHLSEVL